MNFHKALMVGLDLHAARLCLPSIREPVSQVVSLMISFEIICIDLHKSVQLCWLWVFCELDSLGVNLHTFAWVCPSSWANSHNGMMMMPNPNFCQRPNLHKIAQVHINLEESVKFCVFAKIYMQAPRHRLPAILKCWNVSTCQSYCDDVIGLTNVCILKDA